MIGLKCRLSVSNHAQRTQECYDGAKIRGRGAVVGSGGSPEGDFEGHGDNAANGEGVGEEISKRGIL